MVVAVYAMSSFENSIFKLFTTVHDFERLGIGFQLDEFKRMLNEAPDDWLPDALVKSFASEKNVSALLSSIMLFKRADAEVL